MRMLIDCRPLQYVSPRDERCRLILSAARELDAHQGIECIYAIDKNGPNIVDSQSVIKVSALPGRAGWKLWYDWKIPRLAKKLKADCIMTTGGVAAATGLAQVAWMPGLISRQAKGGKGGAGRKPAAGAKGLAGLAEKRYKKNLEMAKAVFCFSQADRDHLASALPVGADKGILHFVPPAAAPELMPLTHEEREKAKLRFANGKEYFFTDITGVEEDELVNLLKAFSRFKKRQLTNMQMVLAGPTAAAKNIAEKLDSYKYRQDVHWYEGNTPATAGGKDDSIQMAAGAYAIVRPFERQDTGIYILEAWKTGVPVITIAGPVSGLAGDAALYAQAGDAGSLAEKLMMIYKDESQRSALLQRGFEREKESSRLHPAGDLWNVLADGWQSAI